MSLLLLSGGSKLEFEALLNSSKELKSVFDRLASSPAFGLVDGASLTALLTEIDKLPLTAADVVAIFVAHTRRGCSGRDVATAVMLIDPAESGNTAVPLYYCLLRLESTMRADSKRGLTKFTAESVRGALRAPFRHVPKFITHSAAAKTLTKRGDAASPSPASSSSSSPLVTLDHLAARCLASYGLLQLLLHLGFHALSAVMSLRP